jgi:sucrose phosphorylase
MMHFVTEFDRNRDSALGELPFDFLPYPLFLSKITQQLDAEERRKTMTKDTRNEELDKIRRLRHAAHLPTPDYTRPLFELPADVRERMRGRLSFLYRESEADKWTAELERILRVHHAHKTEAILELEEYFDPAKRFSEEDLILITYGDLIKSEGHSPLTGLAKILERSRMRSVFSTIHILPFFPYSSDRGFSIMDFETVDPALGSWQDIEEIGSHYQLMFDGVLNHISSKSQAFQDFLNGDPHYKDIVVAYDSPHALTPEQRRILVRPRTSDVLTKYQSIQGPVYVWTTFSADQIDLNYKNPAVLLYILDTLLLYVRRGADVLRLDAVTYLWDEPGTPSVHLEQTHEIIKLLRDVMDAVAPWVTLLTETNVPHKENVSYFGNGNDEAHMVYNFALPPLVLHAFYREDASHLSKWADELEYVSDTTTFLNMLDTHDGVGVMGAKNILPKEEIDFMIEKAKEHGAFISYKTEDGKEVPYEINTTWFSALNVDDGEEDTAFQVKRYAASRSIPLALRGVPAIYFHGLIGTRNDIEAVLRTKSKRDINRKVVDEQDLITELKDPNSTFSLIAQQLIRTAEIRVRQPAFHPNGDQRILKLSPQVFSVFRTSPNGRQHVLAMTNVTNRTCEISVYLSDLGIDESYWYDLVGRKGKRAREGKLHLTFQPYDVVWLTPFEEIEEAVESPSPV